MNCLCKIVRFGSIPSQRSVEDVHGYLFQPVVAFYASVSDYVCREFEGVYCCQRAAVASAAMETVTDVTDAPGLRAPGSGALGLRLPAGTEDKGVRFLGAMLYLKS